jgi:hypothetical protein
MAGISRCVASHACVDKGPNKKIQARNSLMFTPDADVSPYHPPAATAENPKSLKKVDYGHTRLKTQEHDVGDKPLSAPPSPTRSRVDAAIAGTSMSSSDNDLVVLSLNLVFSRLYTERESARSCP